MFTIIPITVFKENCFRNGREKIYSDCMYLSCYKEGAGKFSFMAAIISWHCLFIDNILDETTSILMG